MKNLLRLHTSLFEENSMSSLLVEELTDALQATGEKLQIVDRDFRQSPVPHLDAHRLQALNTAKDARNSEQQAVVEYADQLIAEVEAADVLIIALPMYNFSVPSMFKAWFDHIARAGVTFAYTETGPKGLLTNKKAYLVSTMGGVHKPGETDFLRPYVKLLMNFVGIDDVEFVSATGLNMSEEAKASSLQAARFEIARLSTEIDAPPTMTEEQAA